MLEGIKFVVLLFVAISFISGYLIIYSKYDDVSLLWRTFLQRHLSRPSEHSSVSSCPAILKGGRFSKQDQWEPVGCTLHNYTKDDTLECARQEKKHGFRQYMVFIGDSRIRQLHAKMRGFFSGIEEDIKTHFSGFQTADIQLDYYFLPTPADFNTTLRSFSLLPRNKRPGFILVGSAAWHILRGKGTLKALNDYKANLMAIKPYITELQNTTMLIWMVQPSINSLAYHIHMPEYAKYITNEQIDLYNSAAIEILHSGPFQLWYNARDVAERFIKDMSDGIHISQRARYLSVLLLLNAYCNRRMNGITATCCKPPDKKEFLSMRRIILSIVFIVSLWMVCFIVIR